MIHKFKRWWANQDEIDQAATTAYEKGAQTGITSTTEAFKNELRTLLLEVGALRDKAAPLEQELRIRDHQIKNLQELNTEGAKATADMRRIRDAFARHHSGVLNTLIQSNESFVDKVIELIGG